MKQKILTGLLIIFLACTGIHNVYTYIKEKHRPTITFVNTDNRYYINEKIDKFSFVKKAKDYKGNDIKKKKYISIKVVESNSDWKKIQYTLNDGNGNTISKKLKIYKLNEGVDTEINVDINSSVSEESKPKSKSFLVTSSSNDVYQLFSLADNYGASSNCSYTIHPIKNKMKIIIGYRCEIK